MRVDVQSGADVHEFIRVIVHKDPHYILPWLHLLCEVGHESVPDLGMLILGERLQGCT